MEILLNVGLSNAVAAVALALVAVLAALVWRRPALLHGLWLLVLLKLVTPPLVAIPLSWAEDPAETLSPAAVESGAGPGAVPEFLAGEPLELHLRFEALPIEPEALQAALPVPGQDEAVAAPAAPAKTGGRWSWPALIVGAWLAGTAGWFALALVRLARFGRVLRHARRAPKELVERVRRLAREVGLGKVPGIWLVPGRIAPLVWTFGGWPRLVLPAELFERMAEDQQDTLLLHELAHLRRGDHLVRLLEFVVRGLYWWHPVVWYAGRELREAEEQCCDAWVVSTLPGSGKTYAVALVETLDFLSEVRNPVPVLASGIGRVSDLKRRLRMIMGGTTPRSLTWGGLLAMLVVGEFALPLGPTLAQDKPTREKPAPDAKPDKPRSEDLDKARAEMMKLQEELHRKRDEMHALEKKVAEVAEKLQRAEGEKGDPRPMMILRLEGLPQFPGMPGAGGAGGSGAGGAGGTGGKPREIILREVDGKWIIVNPTPGAEQFFFKIRLSDNLPGAGAPQPKPNPNPNFNPGPRIAPVPPTPPNPPQPAWGGGRIERLEQRIQELEKLIRELKKPETAEPRKMSDAEKKAVEQALRSMLPVPAQQADPRLENLERKLQQLEELIRATRNQDPAHKNQPASPAKP